MEGAILAEHVRRRRPRLPPRSSHHTVLPQPVIRLSSLARQACPGATAPDLATGKRSLSGRPFGRTLTFPIMSTTTHPTVLGIDPGTSEMGLAVIRGRELLAYGVRKLRNGTKPYDLIGQARRILFAAIRSHAPDIVAIEKALLLPTKRASLMAVIVDELRQRAAELNLTVAELSPLEVRQAVVGIRGRPRSTWP